MEKLIAEYRESLKKVEYRIAELTQEQEGKHGPEYFGLLQRVAILRTERQELNRMIQEMVRDNAILQRREQRGQTDQIQEKILR